MRAFEEGHVLFLLWGPNTVDQFIDRFENPTIAYQRRMGFSADRTFYQEKLTLEYDDHGESEKVTDRSGKTAPLRPGTSWCSLFSSHQRVSIR